MHVSLGQYGVQSWPWQEAAKHVGFEVPRESLVPWEVEAAREKAQRAEMRKKAVAAAGDGKWCRY